MKDVGGGTMAVMTTIRPPWLDFPGHNTVWSDFTFQICCPLSSERWETIRRGPCGIHPVALPKSLCSRRSNWSHLFSHKPYCRDLPPSGEAATRSKEGTKILPLQGPDFWGPVPVFHPVILSVLFIFAFTILTIYKCRQNLFWKCILPSFVCKWSLVLFFNKRSAGRGQRPIFMYKRQPDLIGGPQTRRKQRNTEVFWERG